MPIAPQLLPVENAVNAANTNTMVGKTPMGKRSPKLAMRKSAVCNSELISAIAHDSTKIIMARNVNRAPLTHASTTSSSDSKRCERVITTATSTEIIEAHISA